MGDKNKGKVMMVVSFLLGVGAVIPSNLVFAMKTASPIMKRDSRVASLVGILVAVFAFSVWNYVESVKEAE